VPDQASNDSNPEGECTMNEEHKKSKRGFASMDRDKQRQIASKGGKAAHAKGTAHEFTPEEAVEAGRKGGKAAHAKGTAHRFTTPQPEASAQYAEPMAAWSNL